MLYLVLGRPFSRVRPITLAEILDATGAEARNYGDWVAKGGARERIKTETPTEPFDLTPRKVPINAEAIFLAPAVDESDKGIGFGAEIRIEVLDDKVFPWRVRAR